MPLDRSGGFAGPTIEERVLAHVAEAWGVRVEPAEQPWSGLVYTTTHPDDGTGIQARVAVELRDHRKIEFEGIWMRLERVRALRDCNEPVLLVVQWKCGKLDWIDLGFAPCHRTDLVVKWRQDRFHPISDVPWFIKAMKVVGAFRLQEVRATC